VSARAGLRRVARIGGSGAMGQDSIASPALLLDCHTRVRRGAARPRGFYRDLMARFYPDMRIFPQ